MKSVIFPSTLETLGQAAFGATGLINITLPASLKVMYGDVFTRCQNLISVDMSSCNRLSSLPEYVFGDCISLNDVKLPSHCKGFDGNPFCTSSGVYCSDMIGIETLALPEGFSYFGSGSNTFERANKIASVWWPKSLLDGTALGVCNLKEIHYYGTETEWKMVAGNNLFPNAVVTFNEKYPYANEGEDMSVSEMAADSFCLIFDNAGWLSSDNRDMIELKNKIMIKNAGAGLFVITMCQLEGKTTSEISAEFSQIRDDSGNPVNGGIVAYDGGNGAWNYFLYANGSKYNSITNESLNTIMEMHMTPYFQNGNYEEGLYQGIIQVYDLIMKEFFSNH